MIGVGRYLPTVRLILLDSPKTVAMMIGESGAVDKRSVDREIGYGVGKTCVCGDFTKR